MDKKNSLINLGCRLNIYEGEIIKNNLNNNNLKNVTVINSCAVTAEAEKKVAYEIRKAKRINPENKIIVTGCAAQINPKKYHDLKEVDLVLGNKEKLLSDVWSDLIGCDIIHKNGNSLGNVISVDNFGAGDLLEIIYKNKKIYIPLDDNVLSVDLEKKIILVDPIKGIIDND